MSETLPHIYATLVADGSLIADPAQEDALPALEAIRAQLEATSARRRGLLGGLFAKAPEAPKGLYLWGGVGRGKSMLMDLFFASVDIDRKRRVHFHAFMQEIQGALHEARKGQVEDAIQPVAAKIIAEARLLCFDEMQITDIADAMIVGRLFEALFKAGVVVVTTSNRVPDDLYKDGLNRTIFLPFIELLKQRMVVRELVSPRDYRQDRMAGSATYFTPINAEARSKIEEVWQRLSGGKAGPLQLVVKGREVVLPAFHNGVARAKFWDLCGKPLGAADYLALTEAVRVLVLEDVPQLGRSNFNEAKRFVTLIDTLYEAKTQLVCSAQASPEMLYMEGEGTFEFERTASRLREMQSEGWGVSG
ncbi:cell division protein ZapE [Pseudogemmobacter sp. W21_MBD1_M6]|uniref:cell division protein ZapE n=1 Tax=Pseudogemmobacter sp. W21_MBD1_M6 TaxID=3240271 RepID=UPI003F98C91A